MFGMFKGLFGGESDNANLAQVIKQGAFLVDVRTPGEFASGSVKGAVNIPLDKLPNQIAKFQNKQNIVVFCQSGGRSGQAQRFLEQKGFNNVVNGGSWRNVYGVVNAS